LDAELIVGHLLIFALAFLFSLLVKGKKTEMANVPSSVQINLAAATKKHFLGIPAPLSYVAGMDIGPASE